MAAFLRKLCDLHCRSGNAVSLSLRSCHVAIQGIQSEDGSNKVGSAVAYSEHTQGEGIRHQHRLLPQCNVSCTTHVGKDTEFICRLVCRVISTARRNPHLQRALQYHGIRKDQSSKRISEESIFIWYSGILALSGIIFNHGWQRKQKNGVFDTFSLPPSWKQVLKHYFWGLPTDHLVLKVNAKPVREDELKSPIQTEGGPARQPNGPLEATDQDLLSKAFSNFSKTKEESVVQVLNTLGIHMSHGSEHEKAFLLFKQAASHGDVTSLYNVGLCYEHGRGVTQSLSKAMKYYRLAANKGHSKALYNLAAISLNKISKTSSEQEKGLPLMEGTTENKIVEAQRFLGIFYAKEKNWRKAFHYFKLAAEGKDTVSLYNVGLCYERGLGTDKDVSKAVPYYLCAAEQGHKNSQFNMGVIYEKGLGGVTTDALRAIYWYSKASEQGDGEAKARLDSIKATFTIPKTKNPVRKTTVPLPQWNLFGKDFPKSFSSPNLQSGIYQKAGYFDQTHERELDLKQLSLIVSKTVL